MFGRKTPSPRSAAGAPISTILGEKTSMQGEIKFSGSMRIDGAFDGTLHGEHLIIGSCGSVRGEISCISCICHGQIHGQLAADTTELKNGSLFEGTLLTRGLSVEPGATLNGDVRQQEEEIHLIDGDNIEKIGTSAI
ncbi:MAG: polymer-forming cytoskeletal protein [Desulfuromonadaceae bacterium]|nr:polymer-forming cytoskeletal protein [Desulfuromonadaceae bacterium]